MVSAEDYIQGVRCLCTSRMAVHYAGVSSRLRYGNGSYSYKANFFGVEVLVVAWRETLSITFYLDSIVPFLRSYLSSDWKLYTPPTHQPQSQLHPPGESSSSQIPSFLIKL